MFALALGIKNVKEILPQAVYALLSGLNSATVGIVALAAVQLAEKAITDKVSRILVIFGACAGLCYTALWYFPLLIAIGGLVTVLWDLWAKGVIGRYKERRRERKAGKAATRERSSSDAGISLAPVAAAGVPRPEGTNLQHRRPTTAEGEELQRDIERQEAPKPPEAGPSQPAKELREAAVTWGKIEGTDMLAHAIPVKVGIAIIVAFFGEPSPTSTRYIKSPHTNINPPPPTLSIIHCCPRSPWRP